MRQKDEEKKESIKQAVIKLILEQGFHGASIAKIAREAGVSPATVYIYYANKDDMLREIYEEYADQAYFYLLGIINSNMSGKELILWSGAFMIILMKSKGFFTLSSSFPVVPPWQAIAGKQEAV